LGDSPESEIYMPTFRNTLSTRTYLPMKMEQTECSETSAYKFQTPGNHPKESIQHPVHGESLKSKLDSSLKIGYFVSFNFGCYNLQYAPASKPFDQA